MRKIIAAIIVLIVLIAPVYSQQNEYIAGNIEMYVGDQYPLVNLIGQYIEGDLSDYQISKDPLKTLQLTEQIIEAKKIGQGYIQISKKSDSEFQRLILVNVKSTIDSVSTISGDIVEKSGNSVKLPIRVVKANGAKAIDYSEFMVTINNKSIVSVSDDLTLTLKASGSTKVTISHKNGDYKATFDVVSQKSTISMKVIENVPDSKLLVGEQFKVITQINGKTDNSLVDYYTSTPDIISIDKEGNIKGLRKGKGVYVIESIDKAYKYTFDVNIYTNISGITIDKDTIKLTEEKLNDKVSATIQYRDVNSKHIVDGYYYYSEDPKVATVDKDGNITAIKSGATKIYVRTNDKSASDYVYAYVNLGRVQQESAETATKLSILNTEKTIAVGEKLEIRIKTEPENSSIDDISYSVSNPVVGSLEKEDDKIFYTSTSEGTNSIILTTDGGRVNNYSIRSKNYVKDIKLDMSDFLNIDKNTPTLYLGQAGTLHVEYVPKTGYALEEIPYKDIKYMAYPPNIYIDTDANTIEAREVGIADFEVKSKYDLVKKNIRIAVRSGLIRVDSNVGKEYRIGDAVDVTCKPTYRSDAPKDLKFEYEVILANPKLTKAYVDGEIQYENNKIEYLKNSKEVTLDVKNILMANAQRRLKNLITIRSMPDGVYYNVPKNIDIVDRSGQPIVIAEVEDKNVRFLHEGTVDVITKEVGSPVNNALQVRITK